MLCIFFRLLLLLCVLSAAPARAEGQANVFVYHRFGDGRYPSTNISLEAFASQLEYLKERDYVVLPLGEIVDRLNGGVPLPPRCAALTVDDAYRSFLTGAVPLLRRYGYPATLFVSTDAVGGEEFLGWDDLRVLMKQGIEIGNHSASHPYLLERKRGETEQAWRERIRSDIERASAAFRQELGTVPRLFAYPYGEYSLQVAELVRELGFSAAAAQHSGVVSAQADRYVLPRFPMGGEYATLEEFTDKLAMRPLPVRVVDGNGPVVDSENPPELVFDVTDSEIDLSRMRCFVQGQQDCSLTAEDSVPGRYRVRATLPLTGRRSRYTVTAPGIKGQGWYWFSQLWIFPQR